MTYGKPKREKRLVARVVAVASLFSFVKEREDVLGQRSDVAV
jgi:hypothetical protein